MKWNSSALLALILGAGMPLVANADINCTSSPGGKVTVDGTVYEMPDVVDCQNDGDFGGGVEYGGNWGGGGGVGSTQYCAALYVNKPAGCESPDAVAGYNYGTDQYMIGSGLFTAISNVANNRMVANARQKMLVSLSDHTVDLSNLATPLQASNQRLLDGVAQACDIQLSHDSGNQSFSPHPGGVSPGLQSCLGTLSRLYGEANQSPTSYFRGFLDRYGIDLSDLGIPQTFINWFSPENSLNRKFELVSAQAQCNVWFAEVRSNGC